MSGWRRISLSGLLNVKGTVMREQGSLKGEGTHRANLCVDAQIFPNPDSPKVVGTHSGNLCVDAQIVPNPDSPIGGA